MIIIMIIITRIRYILKIREAVFKLENFRASTGLRTIPWENAFFLFFLIVQEEVGGYPGKLAARFFLRLTDEGESRI